MKRYIGVFDSGCGGMTVVENIRKALPEEDIVFFADTKNLPYGEKTREELRMIAKENVRILDSYPLKALVIACNTMDSGARDIIDQNAKEKVFGVIAYASEKAVSLTEKKKIGVLATKAVIRTGTYRRKIQAIDPEIEVYSKACPLLVPMIEDLSYHDKEKCQRVLKKYLLPLKRKGIDTLILGCTHYPILAKEIQEILPDVQLVSSSLEVVNALNSELIERNKKKGRDIYLVSDDAKAFSSRASLLTGRKVSFKEV